jgi:hypothetical protein
MSWPVWFLLCIVPAIAAYGTGQAEAMLQHMQAREHSTSKGQQGLVLFAPLLIGGFIGFHAAFVVPTVMTMAGTPGIRTACFLMPECTQDADYLRTADPKKPHSIDYARYLAVKEGLRAFHGYMRGDLRYADPLLKSLQWISAFIWAYAALLWSLPLMRLAIGAAVLAGLLWVAWFVIKTILLAIVS